jgi:hypothetical protein
MCEINKKMILYYVNICKHEHEKNMTRLWCKIMPKTSVEQTKKNEGSPLWGFSLKKFPKRFLCVH